jgi:hypothetical protein
MALLTAPTVPGGRGNGLGEWLDSLPVVDGVRPVDRMPMAHAPMQRPAYRRQRPPGEPVTHVPHQEIVSLVRESGVLRWRAGAASAMTSRRRGGGRAALPPGEVVKQYAFERLEPSQVYTALVGLDKKLTPAAAYAGSPGNGLRRFRNGQLEPFADSRKAAGKKVLLVIHGTFSTAEALITNGFQKTPSGAKLLADAERKYDLVLAFDHPTLSVSPMLNAFDLAALFRPSPASLDIISHSRGGLVARWYCEAYADAALKRRVVFVGAPLAGTSFAAAPRLKSALDLLTNIADVLRTASDLASANPLFLATSGLLRVIGAVTGVAAKTPMLDAAMALVPGLDGQSRTGNNQELLRLRANTGASDFTAGHIRYFAVRSNFEPKEMGWNFLRFFSKPLQRVGDWGADIIFPDHNDLIVDTGSMTEVADDRLVAVAHDFGTTDRVHHTNYFAQPETAAAVRKSLGIA